MAPIVRICPHCGNYVAGVYEKSFSNKVARTGMKSVAKAGYAGTGAAIGSIFGPLGIIIGGAAGWAASTFVNDSIEETAENIQKETIGIEYTFRCPKCGYVWTGEEEKLDVWVEHNICRNYTDGMLIHAKFTIHGMKGRKGEVTAYFFKPDGTQLKDFNDCYSTDDGFASVCEPINPTYDDAYYKDFELFMPYDELHFTGTVEGCYMTVIVWSEDTPILQSDRIFFNINSLESRISLLKEEHGVEENGENGFRVHVKFCVKQMKGILGRVHVAFFYEDGNPYMYQGQHLILSDDTTFNPMYESSLYSDYVIHCPYKYFEKDFTTGRDIFYQVAVAEEKEDILILMSVKQGGFHWN